MQSALQNLTHDRTTLVIAHRSASGYLPEHTLPAVAMAYAMGMAGSRGMLRRTFYEAGQFQGYTLVAIIGGSLAALGLLAFLVNLVGTLGLRNVLGIILPERWLAETQQPAPAKA